MIGDTLYFTAGSNRSAVAIDAISGDTKWTYTHDEGDRGRRAVRNNNRGLAYWSDGAGNGRVLLVTPGYQLIALDSKTGKAVSTFGNAGVVELWDGLDREVKINEIGSSSPAMVVGDVVVIGNAMLGGTAPATMNKCPLISAVTMRAPANFSGPFAPCRKEQSSESRPGKKIRGNTPETPASGR